MFQNVFSHQQPDSMAVSEFFSKVYGWMAFALALSGGVAWLASQSGYYLSLLVEMPYLIYILFAVEVGLVIYLSKFIKKMSITAASLGFIAFSIVNGLTLSTIFLIYTLSSIAQVFFVTGGVFGAMSLYGYTTKKDLSGWGGFLFMSLVGLILASIVNIWLQSHMIQWVTTYAGIIIFTGLTAYDTQKLKYMTMSPESERGKMAILGALRLYIDFINLFLYLLRIMGNRR